VVDKALANGLMVIINMHHHEEFLRDPEGQRARLLSQWQQIAFFFKDYPENLLFEVFNEPHGNVTPGMWNNLFAEALNVIRLTNPHRVVLIGTAEFGGLSGVQHLNLPADENLILTVHYYSPFEFTHQGASWVGSHSNEWLGTRWNDTRAERDAIISEFAGTIAFSRANNIPVHVGEFGAYGTADMASRIKYTNFLARWFEQQGFSWAYWEFSAGFGIFIPATSTFNLGLVNSLLNDPMRPPVEVTFTPIYHTNFSSGNRGWNLWFSGGAAGSLSNNGRSLVANVSGIGTEGWHAQLVRENIALVNGKTYRLLIKGSSPSGRYANMYVGRAVNPWNAYSGFYNLHFSPNGFEASFTFQMRNPDDANARIVLDLGTAAGSVVIDELRVDEVTMVSLPLIPVNDVPAIYPNPVHDWLFFRDGASTDEVKIFSVTGKLVHSQLGADRGVPTMQLTRGIYLVKLKRDSDNFIFKMIK